MQPVALTQHYISHARGHTNAANTRLGQAAEASTVPHDCRCILQQAAGILAAAQGDIANALAAVDQADHEPDKDATNQEGS